MDITALFDKPKIIGIVANINEGKSMLLYHMIESLRAESEFSLYTFGFRSPIKDSKQIFSVEELEDIENSIIMIDETFTLFDLDNRKNKKAVENTLRLIHHNNNILILCMVPENVKKFIAAKLDVMIFKKCTIPDFINGSLVKRVVDSYSGYEKGTVVLGLKKNEALIFDGKHYSKISVPYYGKYDTKSKNDSILKPKKLITKKKR